MLNENKTNFCIVGHSERRQLFNETNNNIKLKAINLIDKNIIPVICVGETLKEKESKITKSVLLKQLEETIPDIANIENTLVAYEPIWAIGTGLTPVLEEIQEVHEYIKQIDKKLNNFKVLYGGSVKPTNSININQLKSVDGCLVGGASLKVHDFNKIIS
jgi:Triosephosphate isomerase